MQIQSHALSQNHSQLRTLSPKQKIDRAIFLLTGAREDNQEISDTFVSAAKELKGGETHIKAIKFDRPSLDVSNHGKELREQAGSASETLLAGRDEMTTLDTNCLLYTSPSSRDRG